MILRLLYTGGPTRNMRVVTVTGTPGGFPCFMDLDVIESSLLCHRNRQVRLFAYFFSRYIVEFPNATIVMASFIELGDSSKIKALAVWKGGKIVGQAELLESDMINLMLNAKRNATGRLIHLYD